MQDEKQRIFKSFIVPDKGRILKVKKWLQRKKYLTITDNINILEIGYSKGGLLDSLNEYLHAQK